jgi:raffinose/stachyose/melibiose transport system substrate-binding protein
MKNRMMCMIVLLIFISLSLTSCGQKSGNENSSSSSKQKTEITFMSSWGGNDTKSDAIQKILDKFSTSNPNVIVSNESRFGDDFLPALKTDFVTGNEPDVFGLWPGSDIINMVRAGKVADLTGLLNDDLAFKASFDSQMWKDVTLDKKIYGLPVEIIFEGLFINKDLFDKYHVTVPQNYDELKTAVTIFRKNNIIPIAYNSTAEGTYIYQNMALSIGGKNAIEQPFTLGKINSCYITAMQLMRELYSLEAFPTDEFTIDSNERNELFISKKAAMIVQGSWFTSDFNDDSSVEVVPFPDCSGNGSNNSRMVYGLGNGVFHISAKAYNNPKKRAAAIALIKEITSEQSCALLAKQTGMLSNVDISQDNVKYNRLSQEGENLITTVKELAGPPDSYISRPAWEDQVVKYFPYMLEGKMKPEEVWSSAEKAGAEVN